VKISAELILASKNAVTGDVLTTLRLTYPRIILSEFNTHRAISKNTSSTRAIPAKKMREIVWQSPFIPQFIGQHQKGMTPGPEIRGGKRNIAGLVIAAGALFALAQNYLLEKLGVAKGVSGRYLEPYMWVTQVVTATDWQNFLKLRNHKDAEPHFRELARCIARELRYVESVLGSGSEIWTRAISLGAVQTVQPTDWHIPFLVRDDSNLSLDQKLKVSAARAARTSYTVSQGKTSNHHADLELADKLIASKHMSPLEHQAQAANDFRYYGNFKSFIQYRKTIDGEDGGDRKALQEAKQ
jgi:hypothetical protein